MKGSTISVYSIINITKCHAQKKVFEVLCKCANIGVFFVLRVIVSVVTSLWKNKCVLQLVTTKIRTNQIVCLDYADTIINTSEVRLEQKPNCQKTAGTFRNIDIEDWHKKLFSYSIDYILSRGDYIEEHYATIHRQSANKYRFAKLCYHIVW